MTKSISTLVEDIYKVVEGKGGWDKTVAEYFSTSMEEVMHTRLNPDDTPRAGTLRMSNLGSPCKRKLWYEVNSKEEPEPLRPSTKLKFLYGDILEALLLSLAKAAGHKVEGEQDELIINGIVGHRDAVIDGITIDVKSASGYGFKKFSEGKLREDDPFGYISQLSSYVYAGKSNKVKSNPSLGAFLVINKESGEICLDMYDFTDEVSNKEEEVQDLIDLVAKPIPPARSFEDKEDGKSGNMKLGTVCSYCHHKKTCWPEVRTFKYSTGPRYLTRVKRVPDVPEVT